MRESIKVMEAPGVKRPSGGATNFGWPCYEGTMRMGLCEGLNPDLCNDLYNRRNGAEWTPPFFAYGHAFPGSASASAWARCSQIANDKQTPGYNPLPNHRWGSIGARRVGGVSMPGESKHT